MTTSDTTLPNETKAAAQERRAAARGTMPKATDQQLDEFHSHMARMFTDDSYAAAVRQQSQKEEHQRQQERAKRRPMKTGDTTRRARPAAKPPVVPLSKKALAQIDRRTKRLDPVERRKQREKTTWKAVRDAMRRHALAFPIRKLTPTSTKQDAIKSLIMPTLCQSLDFKIARHPKSEHLAYPKTYTRPQVQRPKSDLPWVDMDANELPDTIRFALTLVRKAEQEGIPLFPKGYFHRTVTMHHFYYGDDMTADQWAVVEQMAERVARLLEIKIEFEPLGHITVLKS